MAFAEDHFLHWPCFGCRCALRAVILAEYSSFAKRSAEGFLLTGRTRQIRETLRMPICPKCHKSGPEVGASCPRDDYYFVEEKALESADRDRRLGTLVGDRFIVLDRISEGGMGAVYRALQLPVQRQVALKVLRAELEQSHKVRQRFIREARAISQLSHPNIITLHDFGFDEYDQPYMVMEYAPGDELSGWAQREDVTTRRLVDVTRQLLSALAEAHSQGIVHRDLKPQNVIVSRTGQGRDFPKLLDFGIARLVNKKTTQGLTADGEVFGTPHYMSPEQARGAAEVGPEADVYAMGVMLYECYTGEVPFDADSPLSVLFMHINEPLPEPVPRQGLDLPPSFAKVIYRATEKEADDRYADAAEMLVAFDEALGLMTDTGSLSISGVFPSAAGAGDDDEDEDVARAPTVMIGDDQWQLDEASEDGRGNTLPSHQFSDIEDEDEGENSTTSPAYASPKDSAPVASVPKTSSTLPWGLIAVGVAVVAAAVVIGIGAFVSIGAEEVMTESAEEGNGGEEQLTAAELDSEEDSSSGEGENSEAPVDEVEDDDIAEQEETQQDEDTQKAYAEEEFSEASPDEGAGSGGEADELGRAMGGAESDDSGEREAEPTYDDPLEPADSAPAEREPPPSEPEDEAEEASDDEADGDDDDTAEFEPGKFERPSSDSEEGPTKFQRPAELEE